MPLIASRYHFCGVCCFSGPDVYPLSMGERFLQTFPPPLSKTGKSIDVVFLVDCMHCYRNVLTDAILGINRKYPVVIVLDLSASLMFKRGSICAFPEKLVCWAYCIA